MALPSSGQLGGTPTNAQFQGFIEDFRDHASNQIGGAGRTELTIASGAVTPPARDHGGVFRIDTEGNASTDTLDTITQTNTPDGTVIILQAEDAARVVTLNHAAGGSGQILLTDSTDFVFASLSAWVMLQRRSTDWVEILRYVPHEDLTALTVSDDSADLVRVWDDSAGTIKRLPAVQIGRVLQIVHATDAGSSHSSATYSNLNGATVSITPKSASSKLLIEVAFHGIINIGSGNTKGTFQIYESPSTGIGFEPELETALASLGARAAAPCFIRARVNSTGTSARAFGLWGKQSGTAAVSAVKMVWTITEYLE